MGGGGGENSTTGSVIPPELKQLYETSAANVEGLQAALPLNLAAGDFTKGVAGPTWQESSARKYAGKLYTQPGQSLRAGYMANNIFGNAEDMRTTGIPGSGKIASGLNYATQLASRRIDASKLNIDKDAGLMAAKDAFTVGSAPMIKNDMAMSGLLDSTETSKIMADAWAKNSEPHVTAAIGRESDRMNKMTDTALATADRRLTLGDMNNKRQQFALGAKQGAAGLLNTIGNEQFGRQKTAIDTNMAVGGVLRGIQDDRYKAIHDDILRRQALGEKALFAPFGQSGSMIGSETSSTSSGK